MSLLEKALNVPVNQQRKNQITDEEIELVLAWLDDRVGMKQISLAKYGSMRDGNALAYWVLVRVREAYRKGLLKK